MDMIRLNLFRKLHGISPSQARKEGAPLRAFPRLSFQIQLRGVEDMNCKIQQKETFQLIGKEIRVTIENEENKQKIPAFWEESNSNGFTDQ
ncbi:GyrI-like domain-containing protein [Bacillus atrophaeus]|uniref:GyrI-like domain-containing protein n=1 Tax=Bacillus atrophaeus TaxID=1452 RepID=UPI002958C27E|nr:hypothetical protein [Bacillus atrophaeus]